MGTGMTAKQNNTMNNSYQHHNRKLSYSPILNKSGQGKSNSVNVLIVSRKKTG